MSQKRLSAAASNVTPVRQSASVAPSSSSKREATTSTAFATHIDTNVNRECVTFVWLNLQGESATTFVGALRTINDCVRTYTDTSTCFDSIRTSNEKIFFISSSSDGELLAAVHLFILVEAMFVLDPDADSVRGDSPKLIGVFAQQEELLRVLRETLDAFEQIQLEVFAFETDKVFLWLQLWKEEITSRKVSANSKIDLIEQARSYYRGNPKRLKFVDEFDQLYRPNDSLRWCFRAPFPSRLLRYALISRNAELLQPCHFLIIDVLRVLQQQPRRPGRGQLYRGMKVSNELMNMFETHTGGLVCASGFFTCTKSRTIGLQSASSPGYRPDLSSVLFKIDFDASARFAEVAMDNGSTIVIFDVATSFRVMCVNRGAMSVIKMKTASDEGKRVAVEYKEKHKGQAVQALLDELSAPPKSPTPQGPPPPSSGKVEVRNEMNQVSSPKVSEDELQAQKHLKRGEIDQAIIVYRRIRPVSARILNLVGQLCAEEKQDYDSAVECYTQALKMQEEAGENVADTLSRLGRVHYHRGEFDSALKCHSRALLLYESAYPPSAASIATSLTDISNVHLARKELQEALDYAQQAWTLRESRVSDNETVVATSLVLLTNIHHELRDDAQALKLGTRALVLFERIYPSNPSQSAGLLNTLGLIRMNLGELSEARHCFERALKIYTHIAPLRQSEGATVEKNLQCVIEMQQNTENLQLYS